MIAERDGGVGDDLVACSVNGMSSVTAFMTADRTTLRPACTREGRRQPMRPGVTPDTTNRSRSTVALGGDSATPPEAGPARP